MRASVPALFRVIGFLLVVACTHSAHAATIVVCYPGGPVNEADATTAMAAMLRVIERVGHWPANTFDSRFTAQADDCRQLLNTQKPAFAITSLGLFLDQRTAHHLVPVAQPRMKGTSVERYRLIVRKGTFATLDQLKGKTLGGTVFEEPDFIRSIVFAGKLDPQTWFQLKPARQAIRTLRALDKGELDAVLLNGQQYAALGSLPLSNPTEAIFTSADIPLMGLVADSKTSTADERDRFAQAMAATCSDGEGKKLCDLFGIDAFVPANAAAIEPMIALWNNGK